MCTNKPLQLPKTVGKNSKRSVGNLTKYAGGGYTPPPYSNPRVNVKRNLEEKLIFL
jgi:hypothetical protein